MNANEEVVKNIVEPISFNVVSRSIASCHLAFALAKHLIEKDVIDLDDYMESHKATEDSLKAEALKIKSDGDEAEARIHTGHIEATFELHRTELAKLY
ncbi:hypothetical protein QL919_03045 [Psychrobacter sp. APC 3426]|uniref:hypothetical protein n=1 Tax=Psychrobacter sp. APC 3426 TaxID=3035177 RepID=UPI0025B2CA2F|nr:hypothetical protein [Psychrobacter sp. APC 3426]MDN3397702.1 hypothetical protein [Psychrobacter sp. APC 3426]